VQKLSNAALLEAQDAFFSPKLQEKPGDWRGGIQCETNEIAKLVNYGVLLVI